MLLREMTAPDLRGRTLSFVDSVQSVACGEDRQGKRNSRLRLLSC